MLKHIPITIMTVLLGYTGGETTSSWLAADGSLAAPSYSFASETDLGVYRPSSGLACASVNGDADGRTCVGSGQMLLGSDGTVTGKLNFSTGASAMSYVVNDSTTDSFGWFIDNSTDDHFSGTYGSLFVMSNHPSTTTYMMSFNTSSGNLSMGNHAGTAWTTSNSLGYVGYGNRLDIGGKLTRSTSTSHGLTGGGDGVITYLDTAGAIVGYTRNKDLYEVDSSSSVVGYQIQKSNGSPAGTVCDAAGEEGRMVHDYSNNRVYICVYSSGNGWYHFDLTE